MQNEESFYDREAGVAWGPITLQEIYDDLMLYRAKKIDFRRSLSVLPSFLEARDARYDEITNTIRPAVQPVRLSFCSNKHIHLGENTSQESKAGIEAVETDPKNLSTQASANKENLSELKTGAAKRRRRSRSKHRKSFKN